MKNERIALFFCPTDLTYMYLYGSEISFKNETVFYQNHLLTPGERLIVWENRLNTIYKIPIMHLPILKTEYDYYIGFKGKVNPEGSVILAVKAFNEQKEQIFYQSYTQKNASFSLPTDADSYLFELLNSGNESFRFDYLLVGSKQFSQEYRVKLGHVASLRVIYVGNPDSKERNLYVHFVKKSEIIQELTFDTSQKHLFVCVAQDFTGKMSLTEKQIQFLSRYLKKLKAQKVCLHIDKNAISRPLIKYFLSQSLYSRRNNDEFFY